MTWQARKAEGGALVQSMHVEGARYREQLRRIAKMPGGPAVTAGEPVSSGRYREAVGEAVDCTSRSFRERISALRLEAYLDISGPSLSPDSFQYEVTYRVRTQELAMANQVVLANQILANASEACSIRHVAAVEAKYQLDLLANSTYVRASGRRFATCLKQHGIGVATDETAEALVYRVVTTPDGGNDSLVCLAENPAVNAAIATD
jgi:hypothetical protein